MMDKLIKEIDNTLKEYERYSDYLTANQKMDFTNNLNKVKWGAISSKKANELIKAIHLSEFLEKEFNHVYTFSEKLLSEIEDYKRVINTIELVDGQVKYTKEYADILNNVESKLNNKTNGAQKI